MRVHADDVKAGYGKLNHSGKTDDAAAERDDEQKSKRSSERLLHNVSCAYSLDVVQRPDKKPSPYLFGTLQDISDHGLRFKAPGKFSTQRLISLYLKLTDESKGIKMLGKIVWTRELENNETSVGVKFIGTLPPDWHNLLE